MAVIGSGLRLASVDGRVPRALQLWEPEVPSELTLAFLQAIDVVSALIGLYIAYQAYRGYRRNQSRPMLFVSIGFVLALGVPFALLLAYLAIPGLSQTAIAVVTQLSQLSGLLAIVYGLRMPA